MLTVLTIFYQFVVLPSEINAYQKKFASLVGSSLIEQPLSKSKQDFNVQIFIKVYAAILAVILVLFYYCASLKSVDSRSIVYCTIPVFIVVTSIEYLIFKFVLMKYIPVPPSTMVKACLSGLTSAINS